MTKIKHSLAKYINLLIIMGFAFAGSASSFFRELFVAYHFGVSSDVDVYRVATALPYALYYTLGTVLVGIYLPKMMSLPSQKPIAITSNISSFGLIIILLGVALSHLYVPILADGFSEEQKSLAVYYTNIAWGGFIALIFYFHLRIYLLAKNKRALVSSANLVTNVVFVLSAYILSLMHQSVLFILTASFVISCVAVSSYFSVFASSKETLKDILKSFLYSWKQRNYVTYAVLSSSLVFHLLNISPRFVDRYYASFMQQGTISKLEYAYGLVTGLAVVMGSSLSLYFSKSIAENYKDYTFFVKLLKKIFLLVIALGIVSGFIFFWNFEVTEFIYYRGQLSIDDINNIADIFKYLVIAFPLTTVNIILLQLFLAHATWRHLLFIGSGKLLTKIISMQIHIDSGASLFGVSNLYVELYSTVFILIIVSQYSKQK